MMAGCSGERLVSRQQRRVERFGERDVDGVIGRQIFPQIPDTRQKEIVRISMHREIREVGQSRAAALQPVIRKHDDEMEREQRMPPTLFDRWARLSRPAPALAGHPRI